jgi:hypothetical protein
LLIALLLIVPDCLCRGDKERGLVEAQRQQDRIDLLSQHVEKLMVHLKAEAAAKARAAEDCKRAEQESVLWQQRNAALQRRAKAQKKTVEELTSNIAVLQV